MARTASRHGMLLLASRPSAGGSGAVRRTGGRFSVLERFPLVTRFLPAREQQETTVPDALVQPIPESDDL